MNGIEVQTPVDEDKKLDNPCAFLFRIASNLAVDQIQRIGRKMAQSAP